MALGLALYAFLFVLGPFAAGYLLPDRDRALAVVVGAILVLSFAPLGGDQLAPWQDGYPAEGDWRIVALPLWLLVAIPGALLGAGARRSRPRRFG